ncbi:MAG TPA: hypothetical protein VGK99_17670 [Acidobacteriota bacterium]|jgi:hypothetical protein|nr:hypothetical protein [Blastocatellia bacterium]
MMTWAFPRQSAIALALLFAWPPNAVPSVRQPRQQPTLSVRPDDVQSLEIPAVSQAELELVRRARESLNSAPRWNHRDAFRCPLRAASFSIYCALEAFARPGVDAAALKAAQQEARLVIWDIVVSKEYGHPLTDYNNDPSTTFADVQRLFRWLETRVQKRLGRSATVAAQGVREDDSQANPPATAADLEIVREARRLLRSPAQWNSHDTRDCPAGATTFSFYCALVEASDRVARNLEQRGAAMQEARFVVDALANGRKFPHRLMDFNNDPGTGYAGVQEALRLLEQRVQQRVEARK